MIFLITGIVILFFLCIRLCVYIIHLKLDMKNIQEELRLTRNSEYNRQLTVDLTDDNLCSMAAEINRNLDYQKKLRKKSEEAELSLKRSVSDIAHDLRTPLTVISGNLQMLKNEPSLSSAAREYIRISEEKCAVIKMMADDFFQLSVLESDYTSADIRVIDITNELMQFIADNESVIRTNGLSPDIVFPEKSVFAAADPVLLSRIFGNLLNNVIKYAAGSFKIVLSEDTDAVSVTFINNVSDSQSIDTSQLFNRTYRADKSRNSSGAGIGLYIVKLLAQKQGSEVFANLENNELYIGIRLNKQNKEAV
ncbi:MAG: HAMP domain-containing sensor histidine kinase [Oscillospiraceae bacterium]|nr:HAMP domain-containing sensor histidine kinase [Oscillospiraceae bacterium]